MLKNKINSTKITYLLTISIFSLTLFFNISHNANAATKKDGRIFGDWKISCNKEKDKKKQKCYAQQSISMKKDDKNVHIVTYQFFYEDKDLKILQILPQGILLQPGTTFFADKKTLTKSKFTVCQNQNCMAVGKVGKDELKEILSKDKIKLGVFNISGKQINFEMSNKGLKKALNFIN